MFILGIGYKARQGKDEAAKAIVKFCGRKNLYAKQYAFADAIKIHCRIAYGMERKDARLLQMVGTDVYRNMVNSNFWVNILKRTIVEQNPDVAVITDVRFKNECDMIRDLDGKLMKVSRRAEHGPWVCDQRDNEHSSETELDSFYNWDADIEGQEGNLVQFQCDVVTAFERMLYPERVIIGPMVAMSGPA